MSRKTIHVENLGKEYAIGVRERPHQSLREVLSTSLSSPWRRWRRIAGRVAIEEKFWALRDVSFTVTPGEVVGIIGRNGAGKSTLLKILSRITAPTTGRIELRGRLASLLEVGTGFHPELTGRENVFLNGAILGMRRSEIQARFDEIVAFAEVEKFLDTPVKHYSSGMYVRLAFAVAAHLDPEILVVDEVLAVGDASFQRKCLGKMGEVAGSGRTILFVSHNLSAVRRLCARALVLENGNIISDATIEEAIGAYMKLGVGEEARLHYSPDATAEREIVALNAISLEGPDSLGNIGSHENLRVVFDYRVTQKVNDLRIGFDLRDQEGTLLFRSFEDDAPERAVMHDAGRYLAAATVPGDLLRSGQYSIDVRITIHRVRWLVQVEGALRFSVDNRQGINSQYDDIKPGLINPRFPWSRTLVHDN